jgi:hypothetical protein
MKSNDYYRAVLLGVIVGMGLLSLLMVINPGEDVKPSPPDQKFEVVDTYKGCEVVKYTDSSMATYKYFLDCSNK